MLTEDGPEPVREVGAVLGLDEVCAQQTPASKVAAVRAEQQRAVTVMVGDGLNDAPALAAATVGVAMGARGATASSEAADVVLTTDRLDRMADAMEVARYTRRLVVQSAAAGMGLSLAAMALAAVGLLPPTFGALPQEGIDVAVILNALRALYGGQVGGRSVPPTTQALLRRFATEHDDLHQAPRWCGRPPTRWPQARRRRPWRPCTGPGPRWSSGWYLTRRRRRPSSTRRWPRRWGPVRPSHR
jgi:hypothetical protein